MTLGLNQNQNENELVIDNVNDLNSFGVANEGSLQPLLNSYRVRAMNESMDKAKAEIKNLLAAENDAEFARKLKIAIQKYWDPIAQKLTLPPEILQMIQETRDNPDLESMISILEEIGFLSNKTVYTKEERDALSENTTQVLQRVNKKIEHTFQKTQEINQMTLEIMQMLRSCMKKDDEAKMAPTRGIQRH